MACPVWKVIRWRCGAGLALPGLKVKTAFGIGWVKGAVDHPEWVEGGMKGAEGHFEHWVFADENLEDGREMC